MLLVSLRQLARDTIRGFITYYELGPREIVLGVVPLSELDRDGKEENEVCQLGRCLDGKQAIQSVQVTEPDRQVAGAVIVEHRCQALLLLRRCNIPLDVHAPNGALESQEECGLNGENDMIEPRPSVGLLCLFALLSKRRMIGASAVQGVYHEGIVKIWE